MLERLRAIAGRIGLLGVKPRTVALVLIAAAALYASVDLIQKIAQVAAPVIERKSAADAAVPAKAFEKKPRTAYQVIVARNLFGSTDKESAGVVADSASTDFALDDAEPTTLQLDLLGTIAGEGDNSRAVIDERGANKPRVYKVGDQVGGATIERIMRKSVLLRVEGREEILKIKVSPAGPIARFSPRVAVPGPAPLPAGLPAGSPVGNIRNVIAQTGARPHFEGGKMTGYYIGRVDEGSFLQRFGLQSGDIVEGINDLTFTKPDDIKQLQNLKAVPGGKSTLKVKRNGKQITLNVN